MILNVIRYDETPYSAHKCNVYDDEREYLYQTHIDLLVEGAFPKDTTPESLVGKTFYVEDLAICLAATFNINPNPVDITITLCPPK